jgi:NAD(P)-dependent dehydrogenase (short-subunit alcohol dehydrogenase family)
MSSNNNNAKREVAVGAKSFNLDGKCALVTGAAGLLGYQHCAALMENGAHVVLTDVDLPALEAAATALVGEGLRGDCSLYVLDITSPKSVAETSAQITRSGRRIDILVNNAAINPKVSADNQLEMSRLENFQLDDWNIQINVGLTGAFLCAQQFGSLMAADGLGGNIINISSDLSMISPDQRIYMKSELSAEFQPKKPVTYSVIKAGLAGLTRYLATYWAEHGVRSNTLSPGGVYVDQNDEFVDNLTKLIPMGRMAQRDEYRAAIQFLASDASAYLNGQNIVMDGGRSIW